MQLHLTADEVLTTTRSVRKRLDLERPVDPEVLTRCIEIALQAPTGSNSQTWQWVVVTDPERKAALANLYGRGFDPYIDAAGGNWWAEGDPRNLRQEFVTDSARFLRDHFAEVPVMVIPCAAGRLPEVADNFAQASYWGSVCPAVWSFMLALRDRGLGSTWTTLHLPYEHEAAEILGIPYDKVTQVGLLPVAHTIGTDFRPASRLAVDDVVHWEKW